MLQLTAKLPRRLKEADGKSKDNNIALLVRDAATHFGMLIHPLPARPCTRVLPKMQHIIRLA